MNAFGRRERQRKELVRLLEMARMLARHLDGDDVTIHNPIGIALHIADVRERTERDDASEEAASSYLDEAP